MSRSRGTRRHQRLRVPDSGERPVPARPSGFPRVTPEDIERAMQDTAVSRRAAVQGQPESIRLAVYDEWVAAAQRAILRQFPLIDPASRKENRGPAD